MESKEIKTSERKWNRLIDAVFKSLKYKKITIGHAIYIRVFSDGTVSYITVFTEISSSLLVEESICS